MTMRFLQAGLLLALAVTLGVAQDAPDAPAATAIKPLELYRVQGRAWSHRIVEWKRGSPVRIKLETGKVTESNAETADYSTDYVLRGGGESGGASRRIYFEHDLKGDAKAWADDALAEETLELSFGKFVCRRHVTESDGARTTTWVSAEFHPLIVKQVKLGTDTCEIRTLTSFDSQAIDPWALYRIAGRSWTWRSTMNVQGMDPMVSFTRTTVASVDERKATISTEMLDKDQKPMEGLDASSFDISFDDSEDTPAVESEFETTRERCKVEAGEFECVKAVMHGTTSWSSAHWPGLIIRSEGESYVLELVEIDLGHDHHRLYRKVGNYCVTGGRADAIGDPEDTTSRTEVVAIEDGKATIRTSVIDAEGKQKAGYDRDIELIDDKPFMAYNSQVEETVTVPAGTFRCIRQDMKLLGMVIWTHHGVVVKSESVQNGETNIQVLLELNME